MERLPRCDLSFLQAVLEQTGCQLSFGASGSGGTAADEALFSAKQLAFINRLILAQQTMRPDPPATSETQEGTPPGPSSSTDPGKDTLYLDCRLTGPRTCRAA